MTSDQYWLDRDDAAVLVVTALTVGNERAVAAVVAALGKDRLAELIPVVQPAALPKGVAQGVKHQSKTLKALRTDLATAAGVEDVPPPKIRRLSLVNIGMTLGVLFALGIAFRSLSGVNWASVEGEFENATWGWAFLALILYPLVPMSWATALHGLREQGPAVRPDRAHPARVQLPEPHHAATASAAPRCSSTTSTSRACRSRRRQAPWCSAPASAARSR